MPTASSWAMCLSRATGSRPVQPAITAWSIDMVNGVSIPRSRTLKVRSYTDRALHRGGKLEDAAVGAACRGDHQTHRPPAPAMRGQGEGAARGHVDQRAVARAAQGC